jgi:hypothetical protein
LRIAEDLDFGLRIPENAISDCGNRIAERKTDQVTPPDERCTEPLSGIRNPKSAIGNPLLPQRNFA